MASDSRTEILKGNSRSTTVRKIGTTDLVVDRLYEFYFRNRKGQYVVYLLVFLISIGYMAISDLVFRRSQRSSAIEGIIVISILLVTLPLAYSLGSITSPVSNIESPESTSVVGRLEAPRHAYGQTSINWALWGLLVNSVGVLVAVVFGFLNLSSKVVDVQTSVRDMGERVEKYALAREFIITTPTEGASVPITDLIRGKTPFPEMNHYVVVTPIGTGDDWVQDNPVKVFAGGTWTGLARFGTSDVGAGEKFLVRSLATKATLEPGPLKAVPRDAVFSEAVTVVRGK